MLVRAHGPLRLLDRLGLRRDGALVGVTSDAAADPALMKQVEQAEAYWRALGLPLEVRALRASEHAGDDLDRLLAWAALVWDAPLEVLLARLDDPARALAEDRAPGKAPKQRAPATPRVKRDARLPATRFGALRPTRTSS